MVNPDEEAARRIEAVAGPKITLYLGTQTGCRIGLKKTNDNGPWRLKNPFS
jgi:hypothetical protein